MSDFFPICHCFEPYRVFQPRNGQNKLLSITDGLQPVDKHRSSDIFVVRAVVVGVSGAVSVIPPSSRPNSVLTTHDMRTE